MQSRIFRKRLERLTREPRRHDPYRTQSKPRGTPQCPKCGAVSIRGAWLPEETVNKRQEKILRKAIQTCPACQQKADRYAMGVVELRGVSWRENQTEVLRMIRKSEKIARTRNDQHRILWTQSTRTVFKVYVSMPELARHIGRELEKTFKGVSKYERTTEEPYLRVYWWSNPPSNEKKNLHKSKSFRSRGNT